MSEKVIEDVANYIGVFIESDPKNFTGVWMSLCGFGSLWMLTNR